ncbi:MAG: GntR family transcriptional regulator [Planctomycetota bacterium]|jgi:GntR family transcriptional regulator
MQFRIEHASGRAVYQQIIDQVKRDIALGKVLEGERLPTVRQLAVQLAINPNTIGKAYKQLEQEGIITTRPGAGAFIANFDSQLSKTVKRKLISEDLERLVVDAYHMQVDKETLKKWFEEAAGKFKLERK